MKSLPFLFCFLSVSGLALADLLVPNGDFEEGPVSWSLKDGDGGAEIIGEAAHHGSLGMKVTDESSTESSGSLSPRLRAQPGEEYELSFNAKLIHGSGIGVYLVFYDSQRQPLNKGRSADNPENVVTIPNTATEWQPFTLRAAAPEGTAFVAIRIHTSAKGQVVCYLDDFVLKQQP